MATLGHPRRYGCRKAYWTACGLRLSRGEYLHDITPFEVVVNRCELERCFWVHDETIVCVNIPGQISLEDWISPGKDYLALSIGGAQAGLRRELGRKGRD